MKCYLIRHGQTMGNVLLNFNGCRTNEPLTEDGRAALRKIDDVPEGAVLFASPLKRAIETASIMLPGHKPTVIEDLREMDFGYFEGKNHKMLEGDPGYQEWLDSGGASKVPGGESIAEFQERVVGAFREAVSRAVSQGADSMYIVAHGGTLMAVMNMLTGESYYEFNAPNGAGYCIDLEVDDGCKNISADTYDRFCGGLSDGPDGWRPPQYTPSGSPVR